MYGLSSVLIAGLLFLALLVAIEGGYRLGSRSLLGETTRTQINTIQASLIGILALLLGFTFSLALQRFNDRSEAVVDEANAIGTALLRARLLPPSARSDATASLAEHLRLRLAAAALSLDDEEQRRALLRRTDANLELLWSHALRAAQEDPRPVTSGLFLQAANEMIDAYGRRDAALERHVPEVVLFLLFGTFVLTGSLVGYAAGVAGHRSAFPTYVLVALIVLLVFIIIDLDRPRRGLIAVPQESLTELRLAIEPEEAPGR